MFASMTAPPNMAPIAIMPVWTGAPLTVTLETLVEVVLVEVPFVGLPVVLPPVELVEDLPEEVEVVLVVLWPPPPPLPPPVCVELLELDDVDGAVLVELVGLGCG